MRRHARKNRRNRTKLFNKAQLRRSRLKRARYHKLMPEYGLYISDFLIGDQTPAIVRRVTK